MLLTTRKAAMSETRRQEYITIALGTLSRSMSNAKSATTLVTASVELH